MIHIKTYKTFESSDFNSLAISKKYESQIPIYTNSEEADVDLKIYNKDDILFTVRDILLELSDFGIYCRIWINFRKDYSKKIEKRLYNIVIEINHKGKNKDLVNDTIDRIGLFISEYGWGIKNVKNVGDDDCDEYIIRRK